MKFNELCRKIQRVDGPRPRLGPTVKNPEAIASFLLKEIFNAIPEKPNGQKL